MTVTITFYIIGETSGWRRGSFRTLERARVEAAKLAREKQENVRVELQTTTIEYEATGVVVSP